MDYVSRDTAMVVAVGVIAVAAIAMGASTIQSTVALGTGDTADPSSGSDQGGQQAGSGGLGGNTTGAISTGGEGSSLVANLSTCVRPLSAWYGGILYFGAFGAIVAGFKRRYSAGAAFLGMYALAPVALTAYFLTTDCVSANRSGTDSNAIVEGIGDAAGTGIVTPNVPPIVLVGVFGLALLGTAFVLYRASGDQEIEPDLEEEDEAGVEADPGELAAAAGEAADRLERRNADVDNEVYRAWRDMTALLDVPKPASQTPGEFAEAAVGAGLDPGDVARLTELFEEVRYGERDAASREERAIEVFRSIEAAYGADEDATDTSEEGTTDTSEEETADTDGDTVDADDDAGAGDDAADADEDAADAGDDPTAGGDDDGR